MGNIFSKLCNQNFRLRNTRTYICGKCLVLVIFFKNKGFPGSSVGKESACHAGDPGSIPGSGRSPGEGYGKPLYYSCLENPMDRRAWWAAVHGLQRVGHD